ncbi:hypothetical protein ICM05_01150 [Leucobacter sp. cx-42]|uniref:hypothetical protein n=1 Tax=unclassified Leucobacter TaxID=2621730 RepID=UPI00165DC938|nr:MULTISPECIES: hypothetical protein [unclassified Leucobacter]MBC9953255.1 hypothetical protein [Leucobacter sp. cx-42]
MTEIDVAKLRPLLANSCDEQAHATMNRNLNRVVEINVRLVNDLVAVRDERDETIACAERAEAAIERVRALHKPVMKHFIAWCPTCNVIVESEECQTVLALAALDTSKEKNDE